MTHTPCVLAHPIPGRHLDACTDTDCRGCLPAIATTGLLVCAYDERRARDGLRDAPGLYDDLGDPRTSTRPRTGSSGSDSGSPMLLSPERITARDNLRRFLVTWCMILEDDYALTMPADTVRAMAHHIAVQTGRLLADADHAEQLVAEMWGHTDDDGNRYEGRIAYAWRLARPASSRTWRIACDCGERIPFEPDHDVIMRCRNCGTWGVLSWWIEHTAPKVGLLTADEAVSTMWETYRVRITRDQIEGWVRRGKLDIADVRRTDGPGRPANLYRARALLRLALDLRAA